MTTHQIVGYLASTTVFLTFLTKDMRLLRILAICSNVAFFTYGYLCWLPPILCLHLVLLPINAVRLRETLQDCRATDLWTKLWQSISIQSIRRAAG